MEQRVWIDREDHEDVDDTQDHDREHGNEVPVPRPNVPTENCGQPRELHRFPDGDSCDHRKRPEHGQQEVRTLLQCIVLSLMRMVLSLERVELDHLPAVADIAFPRDEISPFSVQIDESQVNEPVDDEHPHHREVPVPRSAQPAAKRQPHRDRLVLERIATEHLALSRERRVGVEDAEAGADHDDDRHDVHPMGHAHYPVMSLLRSQVPSSNSRNLLHRFRHEATA